MDQILLDDFVTAMSRAYDMGSQQQIQNRGVEWTNKVLKRPKRCLLEGAIDGYQKAIQKLPEAICRRPSQHCTALHCTGNVYCTQTNRIALAMTASQKHVASTATLNGKFELRASGER
jgi:hypothetical protein